MKRLLLIASLSAVLVGCSAVPANKINIQGPTGSYTIETPKNVAISNFVATVKTNGELTIKFGSWSSTNDPIVIDRASAGQVAVINALSSLANGIAVTAARAVIAAQTNR